MCLIFSVGEISAINIIESEDKPAESTRAQMHSRAEPWPGIHMGEGPSVSVHNLPALREHVEPRSLTARTHNGCSTLLLTKDESSLFTTGMKGNKRNPEVAKQLEPLLTPRPKRPLAPAPCRLSAQAGTLEYAP